MTDDPRGRVQDGTDLIHQNTNAATTEARLLLLELVVTDLLRRLEQIEKRPQF